jgi:hypothetical protein
VKLVIAMISMGKENEKEKNKKEKKKGIERYCALQGPVLNFTLVPGTKTSTNWCGN